MYNFGEAVSKREGWRIIPARQ